MKFKTEKIIHDLENQIEHSYSLPIFKGYIAVDKRGVEKIIDEIYSNLPVDIMKARQFLKEHNSGLSRLNNTDFDGKTIYSCLKELESKLCEGLVLAKYAIIQVNEIEKILNKINATLPEEIKKAQDIN